MAWKAQVMEVRKVAEELYVVVNYYKDDVLVVGKRYKCTGAPPSEWIEKLAAQELAHLGAVEATTINLGEVAAPAVVIPPTPDLTLRKFRANLDKARILKELIDFKVILATDPKVVALVDEIKTALATYWDSL